ncbi:PDR/VanB family oxidoreductase [Bradyrhizobium sp. CCBAU 53421]|uniref:PDR/VanB family oxidoreductase n=1 Tax=Bradyrhizobium sp. CCBAU 53421 TaxID=1325120 RepID=UPI00188AC873|nr:PDR/VanB family oxidoreductase [Bradyrhizobium sp. CCBAU 53421]QOZ36529.1 oxidoreductase [Bradyrhizobium sp. CCBAU 53421]
MTAEPNELLQVQVADVRAEAERVRSYVLKGTKDGLPGFSPGAHIDVHLPSGLIRQYSLIGGIEAPNSYHIAVLRELNGRGGSIEFHDRIECGSVLEISQPRNNFPLATSAKRHVLIAGGIGITPILSMVRALTEQGALWHLHYCIKDTTSGAFLGLLAKQPFAARTTLHIDGGDPSRGMQVERIAEAEKGDGAHVYCCGPSGLMKRVEGAFQDWPKECVHFESFTAAVTTGDDKPFEVEIASSGAVIAVAANETILAALRRHGLDPPFLCTQGVCGTCVVDLLEGVADHRDSVLFETEQSTKIVTCCSRAITARLKLGL